MAQALYFTGPHELEVRDIDVPDPAPGEVRVRAELSAISPGSELLVYRGEASEDLPADVSIEALSDTLSFPLRYGYAVVGRVTALGRDVADDWLDRRVFAFHPHASHFTVSLEEVVPVPDDCSAEAAALLANLEAATNFHLDGTPRIGERVLVLGQGVVGLLTTALLAEFPLADLVTADRYDRRRTVSEALGADVSLDPAATDVGDRVKERADGSAVSDGADLTYELSGNPDALDTAIEATGYGGRILIGSWYGRKSADVTLDGRFHRSRIRLISTQVSTIDPRLRGRWTTERRLETARRWLGDVDTERLVTHRLPIERAADAYELLDERPDEAIQVLLTY